MRRALSSILLAVLGSLSSCHVGGGPEACATDGDCAARERCHPDGHFCELDRTPVEISAVASLTGDLASVQTPGLEGYRVAEAELNALGGVLAERRGTPRPHDRQ